MELATHNTMSYRKPKQFWIKLIPFISRCQSVDYKKQHELGAKGFDLRLFWDKDGKLEFRHGITSYSLVLEFLLRHRVLHFVFQVQVALCSNFHLRQHLS